MRDDSSATCGTAAGKREAGADKVSLSQYLLSADVADPVICLRSCNNLPPAILNLYMPGVRPSAYLYPVIDLEQSVQV